MNEIKLSRRAVLTRASAIATVSFLGASGARAAEEGAGSCVDPKQQRAGDKSLRDSMEYTAHSPDSLKECAACAFFQPSGDNEQCGNCVILNGAVDATGNCVSWSPKG